MTSPGKIAIIGAGQAGLQLGLSLLQSNAQTTLYSEHTPDSILQTSAPGTSVMFDEALSIERKLGIDYWQHTAPQIDYFNLSICLPNGKRLMHNKVKAKRPFQAIDQRIKFSVWMEKFKEKGGNLVFGRVHEEELEEIASTHDAVFVATGKGKISQYFEPDEKLTLYDKPQRNLLVFIAKNQKPGVNFQMDSMNVNIFPVGGEVFVVPYLDLNNEPAVSILFEPQPDGPMDVFKGLQTGKEYLEAAKGAFRQFMPWIADSFQDLELVNASSYAAGAIRPMVRKPFAYLPSGKIVFGLGDTVMINDPAAAQGANTACKMACHYHQRIVENESGIFDEQWISTTYDTFWEAVGKYAYWVSNEFLKLKDFQIDGVVGYCKNNALMYDMTEGINKPESYHEWFATPQHLAQRLASKGIRKSDVVTGKLYLLANIISFMIMYKIKGLFTKPRLA